MHSRIVPLALATVMTLTVALTPVGAAAAGRGPGTATPSGTTVVSALPVTADEAAALQFMREEEKLARDVYTQLAATWKVPTFSNIASSEQTHMDAIKTLLDRYGVADPASATVGVFVNQDLQALYDKLVAEGSESLVAALRVGAAIEEIDILDLEVRLAQTEKLDTQRVYENLLRGSRNHLRAFVNVLSSQGETYSPQYLPVADYEAIVAGSTETGGNASNGRRGGGRR